MKEQINLQVSGMSCQHCVKSVEESVMALPGIEKVEVSLENNSVDVAYDSSSVDVGQIAEAIEDQGYDVATLSE
ncbi:copper insertion chaperone and transporter component [Planococcus donghaensis MPA1U2]|uniref:Copper chaperone CopZ n=1 Tax=Planococcus donghaensis MPA1U2 TaxID=933115 RepID=E7RK54_9BACL|nr:copper chaperone CopZ [Planococcus donghaensis]EGA88660.1 copper insertion chaperone and transporter component [Planococcus donghaensis MPA1U2]